MFAKLKKKIAEESATEPRSSIRIPRAISKESITSVGADSGDDFVSEIRTSDLSDASIKKTNHFWLQYHICLSHSMKDLAAATWNTTFLVGKEPLSGKLRDTGYI